MFVVTLQEQRDRVRFFVHTDCRAALRYPKCQTVHGVHANLVELVIKSGTTGQTLDYEPNVAGHTADHFSTWKPSSLFRNTVLQRLNLNTTPALRVTEGGAGISSRGALLVVWHLVDPLLWKCCPSDVMEFNKKPYEFKLLVCCNKYLMLSF